MSDQTTEFDEKDMNENQKWEKKYELFKVDLDEGYAENLTPDLFDNYYRNAMFDIPVEYNSYAQDITEFILKLSEALKDTKNITLKEKLLTDHRLLMVYWHKFFKSGDSRIPSSRKGYTRYMHKHFEDKYSLYRLINLNFMREKMPEEYEKLTEDSHFNTISIIDALIELRSPDCSKANEEKNNYYNLLQKEYYKYDKECRRYIKKVLDLYLPDIINDRNSEYNCLDYCFLAFLLENMDTKNGQALIGKKVIDGVSKKIKENELIILDPYYAKTVRYGLISLVNFHFKPSDASKRVSKIKKFFDSTYLIMANYNIGDKIKKINNVFEKIDDQNIKIPEDECSNITKSLDDIYNMLKNVLNLGNE